MPDPCPGLSVHLAKRKGDGPSARLLHKIINHDAKSVSYAIEAVPNVEFCIIIRVKEDFDFKGSEGLRISISVNHGGFADDLTKSWYVDAMSKLRGRQVFDGFDEAAVASGRASGRASHKQKFIMPQASTKNSDCGVVTVHVERGNLVTDTILSPDELRSEEHRRRSTKEQIEPAQLQDLELSTGFDLAAKYVFCNVGTYRSASRFTKQAEDINNLQHSSTALLHAVEKLSVESVVPTKKPAHKVDATSVEYDKSSHFMLDETLEKLQRGMDSTGVARKSEMPSGTTRIVVDPSLTLDRESPRYQFCEVASKPKKANWGRYGPMATAARNNMSDLTAQKLPHTYARYGEHKQKTSKESKAGQKNIEDDCKLPGWKTWDDGGFGFEVSDLETGKEYEAVQEDAVIEAKASVNIKTTTRVAEQDPLLELKDTSSKKDTTCSIDEADATSVVDDDDDFGEDDDYVMVDEPIVDKPQSGGCACS